MPTSMTNRKSYTISLIGFRSLIRFRSYDFVLLFYIRICTHEIVFSILYQLFYLIRSEEEVEMTDVGNVVDTNTKLSAKQKDATADNSDEP